MELHKANLEAQNQAIAVASSHHILPTASCSSTTNAGLLPAATALFPTFKYHNPNTAVNATNTVNGGLMSTGPAAHFMTLNEAVAMQQMMQPQQPQPQQPNPNFAIAAAAAYHVSPKLKSPSGLIAVSSGRGADKFAPY